MSVCWRTGSYSGGLLNTMERNSDIITMACPALWLRHTSAPAWNNAFINFDNCNWFTAPNYVVMKLYRDHFAPNQISVAGDTGKINVIASRSADNKKVYMKIVNPFGKPLDVSVIIDKGFKVKSAGLKLISPGNLKAMNTLKDPSAVSPKEQKVAVKRNVFKITMPRWSVGVITLND